MWRPIRGTESLEMYLIFYVFGIFGFFGQLGTDISNAFHTAYNDVATFESNTVKKEKSILHKSGYEVESVEEKFFGTFVSYVIDPVFGFFDNIIIDTTNDILSGVGDVTGIFIGIPQGFINYFTTELNGFGIFGLPVTMLIIGIGIVIIVGVGLFVVKLAQYLMDVL